MDISESMKTNDFEVTIICRDLKTDVQQITDHHEGKQAAEELRTTQDYYPISFSPADAKNKLIVPCLPERKKDKVAAAYHEAGHAVCAWLLPNVREVSEVILANIWRY